MEIPIVKEPERYIERPVGEFGSFKKPAWFKDVKEKIYPPLFDEYRVYDSSQVNNSKFQCKQCKKYLVWCTSRGLCTKCLNNMITYDHIELDEYQKQFIFEMQSTLNQVQVRAIFKNLLTNPHLMINLIKWLIPDESNISLAKFKIVEWRSELKWVTETIDVLFMYLLTDIGFYWSTDNPRKMYTHFYSDLNLDQKVTKRNWEDYRSENKDNLTKTCWRAVKSWLKYWF